MKCWWTTDQKTWHEGQIRRGVPNLHLLIDGDKGNRDVLLLTDVEVEFGENELTVAGYLPTGGDTFREVHATVVFDKIHVKTPTEEEQG